MVGVRIMESELKSSLKENECEYNEERNCDDKTDMR
jgi:hypothetical protein